MTSTTSPGKAIVSWSGGKDAAMAMYERQLAGEPIDGLLTTIAASTGRSSMHGVRPALSLAQADALGLPISLVRVPGDGSNVAYERVMREALFATTGDTVVFADIFLEDVRAYREDLLDSAGCVGEWPLWGRATRTLLEEILAAGFRATIVVVDGAALTPDFLGRELTPALVEDLPDDVDPCGENGEFHTFVSDGPTFSRPVPVRTGRRLTNTLDGREFHFVDLLLDPA